MIHYTRYQKIRNTPISHFYPVKPENKMYIHPKSQFWIALSYKYKYPVYIYVSQVLKEFWHLTKKMENWFIHLLLQTRRYSGTKITIIKWLNWMIKLKRVKITKKDSFRNILKKGSDVKTRKKKQSTCNVCFYC